ncbi:MULTISPECIES: TetR/AcrR family transcriptional regulator [Lacticaseibacillus]|uniref:TetR/AcrR family transcriptional regulator n=1 Tax=Lacticaseibacillus hegangensis TaxID=2486010 RepID=A0ABW4CWP7_9LACO|nr:MULTISPECIES: TetR/AcrR family transcriptional regulator [Lacticaseibacillus]
MTDEQTRHQELVARINRIFLRNGLTGQSMAALAKAVGVSRGKLYLYFSSRDAVVSAVVDQFVALANAQGQAPAAAWTVQALPHWLLTELMLLGSNSPVFLADLAHAYPEQQRRVEAALHAWEERLAAYLNEGMARGVFHTIDVALFLAMIRKTADGLNRPAQIGANGAKPVLKHLLRILTLALLDEAPAKKLLTQAVTQRAVTALAGELTVLYQQ